MAAFSLDPGLRRDDGGIEIKNVKGAVTNENYYDRAPTSHGIEIQSEEFLV